LEFNVPFQHKYGYIRDDNCSGKLYLHRQKEGVPDTWWDGFVEDTNYEKFRFVPTECTG